MCHVLVDDGSRWEEGIYRAGADVGDEMVSVAVDGNGELAVIRAAVDEVVR